MPDALTLPGYDDVLAAAARIKGAVRETPLLSHPALDVAARAELIIKLNACN